MSGADRLDMSSRRKIFDFKIKRQIREHYDKGAATYDSEDLIERRPENDYVFLHFLRNTLGAGTKKVVLDVGGGTGRVAIPLANEGHQVLIVDISRQMLVQSRRKSRKLQDSSRPQLVQADAESLPFRGTPFDLVLCVGDVLSYCNTDAALEEAVRVLKQAGALLVGVDNRYALAAKVLELELDVEKAEEFVKTGVGHYPEDWGGHLVRAFTPDELRQHLKQHGIRIQEIVARPFLTRTLTRQELRRLYSNSRKTSLLCELELMICKEPSILGASDVLFAIGTKTG